MGKCGIMATHNLPRRHSTTYKSCHCVCVTRVHHLRSFSELLCHFLCSISGRFFSFIRLLLLSLSGAIVFLGVERKKKPFTRLLCDIIFYYSSRTHKTSENLAFMCFGSCWKSSPTPQSSGIIEKVSFILGNRGFCWWERWRGGKWIDMVHEFRFSSHPPTESISHTTPASSARCYNMASGALQDDGKRRAASRCYMIMVTSAPESGD